MAINLKNSVFFDGGKRINLISSSNVSKMKFTKKSDGSWIVSFEFEIIEIEAKSSISVFGDFQTTEEEFSKKFPNQIYFEAFNEDGSSKSIIGNESFIQLYYDKVEEGGLLFNMSLSGFGKTQSAKTQSADT